MEHMALNNFDPITFQVLWSRLQTIADEVAVTLEQTAFSNVVRDNHDYACGIYDAAGAMLVQATTSTPGQLGSMVRVMDDFLEAYPPGELFPGDVLITNDPWLGSGHTPDIYIATPIFHSKHLAGFAVNSAHHMDVGGRMASPEAREVYEEGLIFPIAKLYDAGKANETLFALMRRNFRMSDKVIGDVRAQVAANHVGSLGLCEMMDDKKLEALAGLSAQIQDQTETSMRASITEVPDGVYEHRLELEVNDNDGNPIALCCRIEIKGSDISVDFEGTSGQVDRPINCVFNITFAYTMFALKAALQPLVPNNAGCFRPITLKAPEGSILNATFPAAVWWRTDIVYYVTEVIFGALADIVPDRIMAASGTYPLWLTLLSGKFDDGRRFLAHFNASGGQGARAYMDGATTMVFPGNIANTPVEIVETDTPLLCECKELLPDSGGAGRHRGGLGQRVIIRNITDRPVSCTVSGGRYLRGPTGSEGGASGSRGMVQINDNPPFNASSEVRLDPDFTLCLELPGGGGYGDPKLRATERVAADLREGIISHESAERTYGVVFRKDGRSVDEEATKRLRGGRTGPAG